MTQSSWDARDQARWTMPNASLWVRPDAARFLKPATRVEDVYPALALKYSPDQPRVPAGNSDGGQLSERFMKDRGLTPKTMSPEDAKDLLREVRLSEDPRIRDFNRNIRMLRRFFRFGRGQE